METNEELLERYKNCQKLLAKAIKRRDKLKGAARDRQSRFCGSLNFNILNIEAELREREITVVPITS